MIQHVSAEIASDGRLRVRMMNEQHHVLTVWERAGSDWLFCDCREIHLPPHVLTEREIGYYSMIGARIVQAMTEVPA